MSAANSSSDRKERFLRLSELLTGFGRFELVGTGMSDKYLETLDQTVSPGVVDEALEASCRLPHGAEESAAASTILADPKIGPVARSLVMLWYCGTWSQLPETWRAANGASNDDANRVVSAEAYLAGLQWVVAGAHPAGGQAQGFGAWAAAPMKA